jgi:hypothetical protein
MAKKLTNDEIEARLSMYDEAWEHLTMSVHHSAEEEKQSAIIIKQIKKLKRQFEGYVGYQLQKNKQS